MSTHIDTILSNTYTKADARHRLSILKMAAEHARYSHDRPPSFDEALEHVVQLHPVTEQHSRAVAEWGQELFERLRDGDLYGEQRTLMQALKGLPELMCTVSPEAPDGIRREIAVWARSNLNRRVMLVLERDPQIIAGCRISWKGRYIDLTLRGRLRRSHEEIVSLVRSYEHA